MFCISFPIFLKFQNYIKLSLLWWHEHLFHHLNLVQHDILGDSKFFLFSVGLICKFCDLLIWHVFKVVIFFNLCVLVYSICSCCCLFFKFNSGNKFLERFFMFNVLLVALLTKMSFNNYKPNFVVQNVTSNFQQLYFIHIFQLNVQFQLHLFPFIIQCLSVTMELMFIKKNLWYLVHLIMQTNEGH